PRSSRPRMEALPRVARRRNAAPVGAVLLFWRRWRRYPTRSSYRRLEPSLLAEPSTASPTGTPSSSILGIWATPEESFMLLMGQWATPVLVDASTLSSSSLK